MNDLIAFTFPLAATKPVNNLNFETAGPEFWIHHALKRAYIKF
jgi:hypothetical protein